MKNCNHCGTEFEPHQTRGHEQLYCSLSCRNKAAIKRKELKIQQTFIEQSHEKESQSTDNREYQKGMDRRPVGEIARTTDRVGSITDSHLATIKELYEAKNQTIFYQLKCETLEKEIVELKTEILNLESELADLEDQEQDNGYSSMLGGVVEQFKQDPVTTMNFATELISNLFKPKK